MATENKHNMQQPTPNPLANIELKELTRPSLASETPSNTLPRGDRHPIDELEERMTFCRVFGIKGLALILLTFVVAAGHATLLIMFTKNSYKLFVYIRPGVWLFGVFFTAFFALFLWFILRWKRFGVNWVLSYHRKHFKPRPKKNETRKQRAARLEHGSEEPAENCYSENFGLNGKYYILRLYLVETVEMGMQLYNIRASYACSLPFSIVCVFMIILIADSTYRAVQISKHFAIGSAPISTVERDRMVIIDLTIDLFFCLVPLCLIFFAYTIDLDVGQAILLVLVPSMSLFGKFRVMVGDIIIMSAEKHAMAIEALSLSRKSSMRKRQSMFGSAVSAQVAAKQDQYVPKWAHKLFCFLNASVAFFYTVVLIVQTGTSGRTSCQGYIEQNGTTNYYQSGCLVKVPFCVDMFQPRCDCAAVVIVGHDMIQLSDKFVDLTSLHRVRITSGPLRGLPDNMEALRELRNFDISFNQVEAFPIDISKWKFLIDLNLQYNNINISHSSLWRHENVINLRLNSNVGLCMPLESDRIKLPMARYLHLGNNSCPLPHSVTSEQFSSIQFLYLNGNSLEGGKLPRGFDSLKGTATDFGLARCELNDLKSVSFWKGFNLRYLNVRDNALFNVSDGLPSMLDVMKVESYFSGNPVCSSSSGEASKLNCEELCTNFCWSSKTSGNGYCDETCNSQKCGYDGGDCLLK